MKRILHSRITHVLHMLGFFFFFFFFTVDDILSHKITANVFVFRQKCSFLLVVLINSCCLWTVRGTSTSPAVPESWVKAYSANRQEGMQTPPPVPFFHTMSPGKPVCKGGRQGVECNYDMTVFTYECVWDMIAPSDGISRSFLCSGVDARQSDVLTVMYND